MATREEIELAIKTLKENGAPQVAVLHCVSSYPAKPEEMNLAAIPDLAKKFDVVAGLSDHTLGITSALASIGLGACIIEKHFTLKHSDGGPDAAFSLEPEDMKQLVKVAREAQISIGKASYELSGDEKQMSAYRRSLFVVENIKAGEKFSHNNVKCIRPAFGLSPVYLNKIIGKIAKQDIERGTPLSWDLIN
jgi:sialic acid synthase SpsE